MEGVKKESRIDKIICTRRELFEIIRNDLNSDLTTQLECLEQHFVTKMECCFQIHDEDRQSLKILLSNLKWRWKRSQRTTERFLQKNEEWLCSSTIINNVWATNEEPADSNTATTSTAKSKSTESKKRGRPSMEFEKASDRTKIRKATDLCNTVSILELSLATQMSLRSSGASTAASIVKEITTKSPTRADKYRAALKLSATPPIVKMSADEALSDVVEGKLSKYQYMLIRNSMKKHNALIYPSYQTITQAKLRCYPSNIQITETRAEVSVQALLNHTSERILHVQNDTIKTLSPAILENAKIILKWGCDGSSRHSEYKQKFTDGSDSDAYVFITSLVPLQLVSTDNQFQKEVVIWKNPAPSSPRFSRPIRLQFLHENVESILNEKKYIEDQVASLLPFETVQDGKEIIMHYEMVFTMIDGKVCNAITSTTSAMRCYLCGATSKQFNNLDLVKNKVIDISNLHYGLSTLHAWIRCFEYLLHLGYKLENKKSTEDKKSYEIRKKTIQKGFQMQLGLLVDRPKVGYGNSNDGNTARRFFENSSVSAQILGLDEDFIHRFHVILQVMSCGYKVNVDKFHKYCHDTAEMCVDKFPWYYMSTTVHKILIHGAQIIESAVLPIGQLSEDAQEARNKDIKKYRKEFSRKNSRTNTMKDVFHWLLVSSDPLISSMRKMKPKKSKNLSSETLELLCFPDDDESQNVVEISDKHDTDSDFEHDNSPDSDSD